MGKDSGMRPLTLFCPGHAQVLVEGFWNFFQTHHQTNFAFQLGCGRPIAAHRLILEIFLEPDKIGGAPEDGHAPTRASETTACGVSDKVNNVGKNILDYVLEFMYTGRTTVPPHRREELLEAAKELDFEMLVDAVIAARSEVVPRRRRGNSKKKLPNARGTSASTKPDEDSVTEEMSDNDNSNSPDETIMTTRRSKRNVKPKMDECPTCGFQTTSRYLLQRHLRSIHGETAPAKTVRCPECHFVAASAVEVRRHQKVKHPKRCNRCNLTFGPQEHLTNHLALAHGVGEAGNASGVSTETSGVELGQTLKCFRCEFQTQKMPTYRRHLASIHSLTVTGEPAPVYHCTDCSYTSTNRNYFKNHRNVHATEKPYKCPHCGHGTARRESLAAHLRVVHALGSKHVICETCGKRCSCLSALKVHNRIHTNEKPFPCTRCELAFGSKLKLMVHLGSVHRVGPNQFTCETCGHRSSSRRHLVVHQQSHTDYRPFQCPHCSRACRDKWKLARHLSIVHSVGPSKFTCETCDKRCHSQKRLELHRKTHTNGERQARVPKEPQVRPKEQPTCPKEQQMAPPIPDEMQTYEPPKLYFF